MSKKYHVHSIFLTLQGEGRHQGSVAVFVRFSGCNVWSGVEAHRERDARNSTCALICDTAFSGIDPANGGGRYTAEELVDKIKEVWGSRRGFPFVVFTGGEPTLQLDHDLGDHIPSQYYCAVETNGSNPVPYWINWVTLSPKPPVPICDSQKFSEIKVLYPLFNPLAFETIEAREYWIQPVDLGNKGEHTARSLLVSRSKDNVLRAIEFCKSNPRWRLSVQMHKTIGIP